MMIANCTALILAGGESRRMGQDKASLMLGEHTLLLHVASALQPLFADIIISTRKHRSNCDFQQVIDNPLHHGPLAGLAAGLEQAKTPWVFAVACDMPFISAQLIKYLSEFRDDYDAVVPVVEGYPQPMAAFYARGSLNTLRDTMNDGESHSMRELLDRLKVHYVNEDKIRAAGHAMQSFFDLDTPQDIAMALNMKKVKQWNI